MIINKDCIKQLKSLPDDIFDSCVTDPPYHLASIVKRFGPGQKPINNRDTKMGIDGPFHKIARGFMGQTWDGGDIAFKTEIWKEVFRVLKPGAFLLSFAAPRNYHLMATAIENSGFEIRDQIMWLYGSGFPKSHKVGDGWGTALKPAHEPIVMARKSFKGSTKENVKKYNTGAINIDECRVDGDKPKKWTKPRGGIRKTDKNAKADLVDNDKGRWPANVIHDGSDEVIKGFPTVGQGGGQKPFQTTKTYDNSNIFKNIGDKPQAPSNYFDKGSAARYFYSAKASKKEKGDTTHPSVKPINLMRYLIKLVTRKKGTVLDPFAGTGTTGEAAILEGRQYYLIEKNKKYFKDIENRVGKYNKHFI